MLRKNKRIVRVCICVLSMLLSLVLLIGYFLIVTYEAPIGSYITNDIYKYGDYNKLPDIDSIVVHTSLCVFK